MIVDDDIEIKIDFMTKGKFHIRILFKYTTFNLWMLTLAIFNLKKIIDNPQALGNPIINK